jgi:N-carbamoylputrescine amidase
VGSKGESGIQFWGQSFVADPDGKIVKQANKTEEEILICEIDLTTVDETKKSFSFPYRDRRIDSYQDLLKRFSDEN